MSDISARNEMEFLSSSERYISIKIHRENDNSKTKISYFFLYSIAAYKVKENDIKISEIFNSPKLIPPKVATRQKPASQRLAGRPSNPPWKDIDRYFTF